MNINKFIKISLYSLLVFLCPSVSFSQIFQGKIENLYGRRISPVKVIIQDNSRSAIFSDTINVLNGSYLYDIRGMSSEIAISVIAKNYLNSFYQFNNLKKSETYIYNIVLQKDTIINLQEVTVKAKVSPITISGDTVSYNVSSFRNGSEKKIEEIIKKLPGVEVNEKTGEIFYKGKSVETVTLEGDNLFGFNYTVGTKNINVHMVEQIQAIENYSENPLLKGIEKGGKVALNLKIKSEVSDLSGDTDFGVGVNKEPNLMRDISANLLSVSKSYKSYSNIAYNNVGVNNSSYDYFSPNLLPEQSKQSNFYFKKPIPDILNLVDIEDRRLYINNSLFGNYNGIVNLNKHLTLKNNLYYFNDKISFSQSNIVNNTLDSSTIITSDRLSALKAPVQYRGDIELKYTKFKNTNLVYKLSLSDEYVSNLSNTVLNNSKSFKTDLNSKSFIFNQSLSFTFKLSNQQALKVDFVNSSNNINQKFETMSLGNDNLLSSLRTQSVSGIKKYLDVRASFLGKYQNFKYQASLGYTYEGILFNSNLLDTTKFYPFYINEFCLRKDNTYMIGSFEQAFRKFRFTSSTSLLFLKQTLDSRNPINVDDSVNHLIDHSFNSSYKIDNSSALSINVAYKQAPFSEEYFFSRPVYTSLRTTVSNEPLLTIQKSFLIGGSYLINDLFKQFRLNINSFYTQRLGNYFSKIIIQDFSVKINNFFSNEYSRNYNIDASVEKYIPKVESNFKFRVGYSQFVYNNFVNNSTFRINTSQLTTYEFTYRTVFDGLINFESKSILRKDFSISSNNQSFENVSFNSAFNFFIKPNKEWFVLVNSIYYKPDIKNIRQDLFFLDLTVRFKPVTKRYEFSAIAKNLTDNEFYNQVTTNDYSISQFRSSLIRRYILTKISYTF